MISVFDLFKIGIGPSSSHTVGPMRAALGFLRRLEAAGLGRAVAAVKVRLLGSLAWTGPGHRSDEAVMLGLLGAEPDGIAPEDATARIAEIRADRRLRLACGPTIAFDPATDLVFDGIAPTPVHANTLVFTAVAASGAILAEETWYSVGGGFVVRDGEAAGVADPGTPVPHPWRNGAELLAAGAASGLSIAAMTMANETARRPAAEVTAHLDRVIATMFAAIDRGIATGGRLPGSLAVARRAPALAARLAAERPLGAQPPHEVLDRVGLWAIAVNEENAAGGRIVTAPTNGAAGVVPAVLRYCRDLCPGTTTRELHDFLLTAAAIGGLFKLNASISGAEVGCQGEVGVACSMAAAGLAAALGGSNAQIENAAEIGMEHHLGLTCDPIGGLVQIPCIERNAFGAVKAITAASLALAGDGSHRVSLDHVVRVMAETGRDMASKYKETSQGGLAVNVIEC